MGVGQRAGRVGVVGLVALLVLTGCGGGDDSGAADEPSEDTAAEDAEPTLTETGQELHGLLHDAMDNDEAGWGEGEDDVSAAEFTDDGYQLTAFDDSIGYWAYPDAGPKNIEDSATTVEVAAGAGEADRWFGTTCRVPWTGPVSYYQLLVNGATGGWAIVRWNAGEDDPDVLADGEDDAIQDLATDDAADVTGTCVGDDEVELAVAVDGTEVGTATDEDGLGAGFSGVALAPLDGDDGDEPVTFSDIEIRGDDGDDEIAYQEDFSDPEESGIDPFDEEGVLIDFGDGTLDFEMTGSAFANLPIRSPIPAEGTASVDVAGDLANGFAGICLGGDAGRYEFAISSDGYGSIGFYPADGDGSDFVLLDEATQAYESTGDHRVTAGWSSNGSATNLELRVDGDVVTSVGNDDTMASFQVLSLCATVASAADQDATLAVQYDDVEVAAAG